MADKLQLKTQKHPTPYSLEWIQGKDMAKVTKQCLVHPFIGMNYNVEVLCDIVDMDVCYLLLGRPWQHDVDSSRTGRDNLFLFYKDR